MNLNQSEAQHFAEPSNTEVPPYAPGSSERSKPPSPLERAETWVGQVESMFLHRLMVVGCSAY